MEHVICTALTCLPSHMYSRQWTQAYCVIDTPPSPAIWPQCVDSVPTTKHILCRCSTNMAVGDITWCHCPHQHWPHTSSTAALHRQCETWCDRPIDNTNNTHLPQFPQIDGVGRRSEVIINNIDNTSFTAGLHTQQWEEMLSSPATTLTTQYIVHSWPTHCSEVRCHLRQQHWPHSTSSTVDLHTLQWGEMSSPATTLTTQYIVHSWPTHTAVRWDVISGNNTDHTVHRPQLTYTHCSEVRCHHLRQQHWPHSTSSTADLHTLQWGEMSSPATTLTTQYIVHSWPTHTAVRWDVISGNNTDHTVHRPQLTYTHCSEVRCHHLRQQHWPHSTSSTADLHTLQWGEMSSPATTLTTQYIVHSWPTHTAVRWDVISGNNTDHTVHPPQLTYAHCSEVRCCHLQQQHWPHGTFSSAVLHTLHSTVRWDVVISINNTDRTAHPKQLF